MSTKTSPLPTPFSGAEPAHGLVSAPRTETVLTLATSADRHKLRSELLRLIINSEQRRKQTQAGTRKEPSTTEGSAKLPTPTVEA